MAQVFARLPSLRLVSGRNNRCCRLRMRLCESRRRGPWRNLAWDAGSAYRSLPALRRQRTVHRGDRPLRAPIV